MTMSQQHACTCGNAELVNMTLFTRYTGTRIFSTGIYLASDTIDHVACEYYT